MAVRVAINVFGRIGRLVFRALVEQGLVAWYDNEWGYSNRCIDLLNKVAAKM